MAALPVRGDVLRHLRRARGLRAMDLAADAGLSKFVLSHLEHGRARGDRHVRRLAAVLGVDEAVLTGQLPPIAALRQAQDLDAATFASNVGVTLGVLEALECGALVPDDHLTQIIATRLGVPTTVVKPAAASTEAA